MPLDGALPVDILRLSLTRLLHTLGCKLLFFSLLATALPLGASVKQRSGLEPRYAEWLHDEVNYLITKDEETEFLALHNNATRDSFMQQFWAVRNLDPNSPTNAVRDEHYRRLAYAKEHFGALNFGDGIHSDRGMVYITLGQPQQREVHPEAPHLRPIEIWFYENTTGGLPAHFYVMFYRPNFGQDFRLYSPYGDRPERLVNGTDAVNDDRTALHFIDNALGVEAEHVALSLIPGEPVDLNDPRPSLQSDVLLNEIRDYRNLPATRRALDLRRSTLEGVSHRVLLGTEFSDLTVVASRDGARQESVHYLFSLRNPQDFGFGQRVDGSYFYSLHLETELVDDAGKRVQHAAQDLSGDLDAKQVAALKAKAFGAEGRLAVASGRYELRLELTNKVTRQTFRQSRAILVPRFDQSLALGQVFFANSLPPTVDASHAQPFSFSGVKLSPRGGENATVPRGAPLRIVFQVWERPGDPASLRGGPMELRYLIGRLNDKEKHEEDQTVDRAQFDPAGNLLLGRDFSTEDMSPGNYRLVIKATSPATGETSYQALNFVLAGTETPPPQRWTVIVPPAQATGAAVASAK